MAKQLYYVDSCVWLNIFKHEDDLQRGIYFGTESRAFIAKISTSENEEIAYSWFILKEVRYKLANDFLFNKLLKFLELGSIFIYANNEDYSFARKLESESRFDISFYDCLHIALCLKYNSILITRDKKLLELAKRYITAQTPEEALTYLGP